MGKETLTMKKQGSQSRLQVPNSKLVANQNPDNLPVEKLTLKIAINGKTEDIAAICDHWVNPINFIRYKSPKIWDSDGRHIIGKRDPWLERTQFIIDDLNWLLQQPFHIFWSNLIYNHSIVCCLKSYLDYGPTPFNQIQFRKDKAMRLKGKQLEKVVLNIYKRIIISRENDKEFMNEIYHGTIIYENFILSVPTFFDICQIFGRKYPNAVSDIITRAIKLNGSYANDFKLFIQLLHNPFNCIDLKDCAGKFKELGKVAVFLAELWTTIEIFVKLCPQTAKFFSKKVFLTQMMNVYENILPKLYEEHREFDINQRNRYHLERIKKLLDLTRISMIRAFRGITYAKISRILEAPNPSEAKHVVEMVDRFLTQISGIVTEKFFLQDYNKIYPIELDLEVVSQVTPEVDPIKKEFILQSLAAAIAEEYKIKELQSQSQKIQPQAKAPTDFSLPITSQQDQPQTSKESEPEQLESLIREVKDIMCDLGEGFIERCLKHYNNNTAAVINALLEDTLPPVLAELDRQLPFIPPDPAEASVSAIDQKLGTERLNIFDGDEFDIMTRDEIDRSRVHKGKRQEKYKNLNEMLNDKSFKKDTAEIYEKYGIIEDDYDDEYDDTYDDRDLGPVGADDVLEMNDRPFVMPRVLQKETVESRLSDSEESDEDDDGQENRGKDRANFCENPEVLRARAEQRRLSKRGGRGGKGVDVVGRPKGQGNEKDVLINRDRKNTNKAARGNHSRRSGAEWKRRQGMVPS